MACLIRVGGRGEEVRGRGVGGRGRGGERDVAVLYLKLQMKPGATQRVLLSTVREYFSTSVLHVYTEYTHVYTDVLMALLREVLLCKKENWGLLLASPNQGRSVCILCLTVDRAPCQMYRLTLSDLLNTCVLTAQAGVCGQHNTATVVLDPEKTRSGAPSVWLQS